MGSGCPRRQTIHVRPVRRNRRVPAVSALAIATALSLAQSCAPSVAPGTLLAFARAESALDPLAIHVNRPPATLHPTIKAAAIAIASRMIADGRSVDLGLLQINSANLPRLGLTIEEAFVSCSNVRAGVQLMLSAYTRCASVIAEPQRCLRVMASEYNTSTPDRGFANGYVKLIELAAAHVIPELRVAGAQAPEPPPAATPPVSCPPASAEDGWYIAAVSPGCPTSTGDGWEREDPPAPSPAPHPLPQAERTP